MIVTEVAPITTANIVRAERSFWRRRLRRAVLTRSIWRILILVAPFGDMAIFYVEHPISLIGNAHVMGDDNKCDPIFVETAQKIHNLFAALGVEVAGGLVGD